MVNSNLWNVDDMRASTTRSSRAESTTGQACRLSLQPLRRALVSLTCALLPAVGSATGVLQLSHSEMRLEGNQKAGRLYAENIGTSALYLDITQQLLLNPGRQPEQLVPVEEVEQPTLLVTPKRLILAPGQRYRIGMRELARPIEPQVWRITFRPRQHVIADQQLDDNLAAPLSVSIGYGVLVYQLPQASVVDEPGTR